MYFHAFLLLFLIFSTNFKQDCSTAEQSVHITCVFLRVHATYKIPLLNRFKLVPNMTYGSFVIFSQIAKFYPFIFTPLPCPFFFKIFLYFSNLETGTFITAFVLIPLKAFSPTFFNVVVFIIILERLLFS